MSDKTSEYTNPNGATAPDRAPDRAPQDTPEAESVDAVLNEAAGSVESRAAGNVESGAQDVSATSVDPAVEIESLRAELAAEQQRNADLNDRLQRAAAEFQNTLRRREKQAEETVERASQRVVLRLLPVIDDFERAFEALPADLTSEQTPWLEGFQQIMKKLLTVLEDEGAAAIPLDGEFDPNLHEAISSEPSDSVPSGHIIATLRVGYAQKGKVIRPALVRVAA